MLYLLIAAGGIVAVVRSGSGEVWARLALLGLGLLAIGQLCSFALNGAVLSGTYPPNMGIYTAISLVGILAHFVGFALLVASALSGRALSVRRRATPEGVVPPQR
ncbi:hypothetical protein EAH86_17890 [Pedococcus bigeumensis]|uniref:Uncharacterized protein n=1 Tax=Pedococcus bigeumensis TaxID=433644 RepID=A0A502CQU9_9MICO|nr:hypothetical protein EAH86_17890 [Pedococcus bigeumensis]